MSEVAVPVMDEREARRVTERIRLTAHTARESIEKLHVLIAEARDGQAHVALGYGEGQWTAYLRDVLSEEPLRLARDQRRELVDYLANEGLSTRAIAPIVGTSHDTVHKDLAGVRNLTPEPQPLVNTETGEVSDDYPSDVATGGEVTPQGEAPTPSASSSEVEDESQGKDSPAPRPAVTGLDGKTYAQPGPKTSKRKRSPLTDAFWKAAFDAVKVAERVERLAQDDRFPQNAEKIAAANKGDLLRARDLLQQVIDQLV